MSAALPEPLPQPDLLDGRDLVEAAGRTTATSGRAVPAAAMTVAVAFLGLHARGLTFMVMFAITFGLSMDYEIFLLSRIAEAWNASGDNRHAVGTGLAVTGRVIPSAALIMTVVFLSFAASPAVVVKMLVFGWPSASSSTRPSWASSWCPRPCS